MLIDQAKDARPLNTVELSGDLVVVGGGLAGVCCAITAARQGIKVVLVQDRPVLGGNASSEVRLWALGATSHMGNNNRWAREGGMIDELVAENLFRNPEGNPLIFDTVLLEKVWEEENITLLLNTAVYQTHKSSAATISGVTAFCSQNSTEYSISAPLFCDAPGDGIVGFQSGAAFRMGAEASSEFDEPFAPTTEYGELLGHSIYFMSKDVGKPVTFTPPKYALEDITRVPRYRNFSVKDQACWMWWIEYGGRLDTVHHTETIKWELWKVVYGVWNYIKNSGKFPEAANLTLEWVGHIPGKRESRRFEGPYMLTQGDIVNQKEFKDAVSYGGWAIDIHPADGVFSEKPGCNQWHSKGIYQIPYRCLFSKNIDNLFLAGRIISASHLAFGSTRVMMTCAHAAQAVAMAAVLGIENNWKPGDILLEDRCKTLQQRLLASGQYIPGVALVQDLGCQCKTSSELILSSLPFNGPWKSLDFSTAQLLPLESGKVPSFELEFKVLKPTKLAAQLRCSSKRHNYTPEVMLGEQIIELEPGIHKVTLEFNVKLSKACYVFLSLIENPEIAVRCSESRITGLVAVFNKHNRAVSNYGRQIPDPSIGFEEFEFWTPERRPGGHNIAMNITPGLKCFGNENLFNGLGRPYLKPNAWVAAADEEIAELQLAWDTPISIKKIVLNLDNDFDHPMESSIWSHPERITPFVVRQFEILDDQNKLIHREQDNHLTRNQVVFDTPVHTARLTLRFHRPSKHVPVSIFGIDLY